MAKKKVAPLRGKELMRAVVNRIIESPEQWDQGWYHRKTECGTTHCVAGWAQVLAGKKQDGSTAASQARELLGLSLKESYFLFSSLRSFADIHAFATAFVAGKKHVIDPKDFPRL